jgi:hypothetical protein
MEVPIVGKFDFERFDDQRYPLSFMLQDALILVTPVFLILIGGLFLG